MITAKELAEKLNGRAYGDSFDDVKQEAKESGLVIVYGASDDLMEFDGAIYDEGGCFDGGRVYFDRNGVDQEGEERANWIDAVCGLTGWCMEILFTSTGSFLKQDKRLIGRTSVWMFPIYGTAAVIAPLYHSIKNLPALLRGCIYSVGIFSFEYISGTFLKRHGMCPWDYSHAKTNIDGVIRLDYAPLWMAAGLLFERILIRCNTSESP